MGENELSEEREEVERRGENREEEEEEERLGCVNVSEREDISSKAKCEEGKRKKEGER